MLATWRLVGHKERVHWKSLYVLVVGLLIGHVSFHFFRVYARVFAGHFLVMFWQGLMGDCLPSVVVCPGSLVGPCSHKPLSIVKWHR